MKDYNRKLFLFDIIYGVLIIVLLIELINSGAFNIGYDSLILTLSVAAALLVVLIILKEQKLLENKIRHPRFFKKQHR